MLQQVLCKVVRRMSGFKKFMVQTGKTDGFSQHSERVEVWFRRADAFADVITNEPKQNCIKDTSFTFFYFVFNTIICHFNNLKKP